MIYGSTLAATTGRELSPRQTECLIWAAEGKTNDEIGLICECSSRTVKAHLENASRKLNASNRTHLVSKAFIGGILQKLPHATLALFVVCNAAMNDPELLRPRQQGRMRSQRRIERRV